MKSLVKRDICQIDNLERLSNLKELHKDSITILRKLSISGSCRLVES